MKLFFETAQQAAVFLLLVPIGMAFGICTDISACFGATRPLWDVAAALLCFLTIGIGFVLLGDNTLRLYHLLAFVCGWLLYAAGLRRMFCFVIKNVTKLKKDVKTRQEKQENGRM